MSSLPACALARARLTSLDRRHDTDSEIPRTPAEIRDMNRDIARKMDAMFTPRGVTVVPSIGVSRLCCLFVFTFDQKIAEQ